VQAPVRRRVLRTFVLRGLIGKCDAEEMAGWEPAVAALGKMFGKTYSTVEVDRDDLYKHIKEVQTVITAAGSNPQRTLDLLTNKTASGLAGLGSSTDIDGIAYRYALKELNPFAVFGLNYAPHNANGALDLYNPTTGEGQLSADWIDDRSKMLSWLMQGNTTNRGYGPIQGGENWQFLDVASGQAAYALSTGSAIDRANATTAAFDSHEPFGLSSLAAAMQRERTVILAGATSVPGQQPTLGIFLQTGHSTWAVLQTGHSIGATDRSH
jgi:hypothetical protein